jgi:hypothetical protein
VAFIASAFGIHLISTIPLHCKAEDVVRSTPSVKETRKLDGGKGYVKTQLIGFLDLYIYIYIYIYTTCFGSFSGPSSGHKMYDTEYSTVYG